MTTAATLSAAILASEAIGDDRFFEATALLSTRFDRRSELGDLRSDAEAPQLLLDWFAHARSRVPDLRVWDLSCQILDYFDPDFGLYLPGEWPWDIRDRVLGLCARLRARSEWTPVFEQALRQPHSESVRALACCAAERLGVDPYPALWAYLCDHADEGFVWFLLGSFVDEQRLPAYLGLARATLLHEECASHDGGFERRARRESLWHVWWEVLRLVQRFPGEGVELLEAALRSNDTGIRIHAIDLLLTWPGERVPPDTITLARELALEEEHPAVQQWFDRLLQRA